MSKAKSDVCYYIIKPVENLFEPGATVKLRIAEATNLQLDLKGGSSIDNATIDVLNGESIAVGGESWYELNS